MGGKLGTLGADGRAICEYLSGPSIQSPAGKFGMGRAQSNGEAIDRMAVIGAALKAVRDEEARIAGGGTVIGLTTVTRRWMHYLLMVRYRNAMKTAEKRSRLMQQVKPDTDNMNDLAEAEENIQKFSKRYEWHKKKNDSLRRRPLYKHLMDVFRDAWRPA